jgi:hypothetical protein
MAGLTGFAGVFVAVAWAMRSPELEEIARTVRRRLGRTRTGGGA